MNPKARSPTDPGKTAFFCTITKETTKAFGVIHIIARKIGKVYGGKKIKFDIILMLKQILHRC